MRKMRIVQGWARTAYSGLGVLGLVAFAGCGDASPEEISVGRVESEIVGGTPVAPQDAPFVAALFQDFGGEFFQLCGGTFIAEDIVLTAAHCTVDIVAVSDEGNQLLLGPTDPAVLRVARRPQSLSALDPS